jgi:hypothetical protein
VRYWLGRQSEAFTVLRTPLGDPMLFATHLVLDELADEDTAADPVLAGIAAYMETRGGLRSGERLVITRFALGRITAPSMAGYGTTAR